MGTEEDNQKLLATLAKKNFIICCFSVTESRSIKKLLTNHGIKKIDEVANGQEVLGKVELTPYDGVFLFAGKDDGRDALDALIETHRFNKTPLIIFSKDHKMLESSYGGKKIVPKYIHCPFTGADVEAAMLELARGKMFNRSEIGDLSGTLTHYNNGIKAIEEEQLDKAEQELREAIKLDDDFVDARIKLAEVLIEKNSPDIAMNVLKKAASIEPNKSEIFFLVGLIQTARESKEQAVASFNKAVSLEPKNTQLIIDIGNACLEQNWTDDAVGFYHSAKDSNPEFLYTYNRIGIALSRSGKFDEAEQEYHKGLEIEEDAGINFNLGILWRRKGDNAKAVEYFQKAVNLDGEMEEAKKMLAALKPKV